MKKILCLFFVVVPAWLAYASTPSDAVDIKHYRFQLALHDSTDAITAIARVTMACRKNINDFELDLINRNNSGKGMQVSRVTSAGRILKFEHQNDRLKIFLPAPLLSGDTLSVTIHYDGVPRDGLIISKNKYGDRTFFADNWPDRGRNWLPVVDHPADKASVEFIVHAPLHYDVVANGIKIEESFIGSKQKLTHYKEDVAISTKVMVIGVARFAVQQSGVIDHIPVESWVYPQNREHGFSDYRMATDILQFFITHIGAYPYKKLANVQSKTTFGGLENASAIFYHENSVTGKADQHQLIAHEIAHQWFGDSVTEKEWHHLWLSEGFATYFALLYMEFAYGVEQRKKEMALHRTTVLEHFKTDPSPVVNPQVKDLMKLLNVNSYQKASWVLHMLRQEIGTDDFWKGIREFYHRYRNDNALTQDFQNVIQEISGKELNVFFNQWIFAAGHPVLNGTWSYDDISKTAKISINQAQKGPLFDFSLEIGFFKGQSAPMIIEKVKIDKQANQFSVPLAERPLRIQLDPSINLLFEGNLKELKP